VEKTAADLGDGAVRIVVSRGSGLTGGQDPPNIIVFGHGWEPITDAIRLFPVPAPWHAAGEPWELAGAKVTSYAPNMSAGRRARDEGFDDALLVSPDRTILEGPTFAVAWVVGETLETPSLSLGILDSITRRLVLEDARAAGVEVVEGRWPLARLEAANEMMVWSTIREVQPVAAVGELRWPPGPMAELLSRMFGERTG
jgi:branched-subunit amino acid aminotransferase/4-amino-4-deoxychorismate lyase